MFEKNPIYMYIYGYNLEKKCEESGFLLLCIKFVFYKKKKNIKAFASKELPRANNSRFFVRRSFPFERLEFIKEFS